MSKKPSIKPIGEALDELIGGLGIEKKIREYDAVVFWETVVGDRIAKVAAATKISQGILFVRVRSSVWRNELALRKNEIREKLNARIGSKMVRDIKFQ